MRRPPRPDMGRVSVMVILLVGASALAGCTKGDAPPETGPVSLLEAYEVLLPAAEALAPSASLVAFEGHEGPTPRHLRGLVGDHLVARDTRADGDRADGRALAWMVLFATRDGGLIRTELTTSPYQTSAEWVQQGGDPQLQALWGLNMGGRLLVDTPDAMATLRAEDAAIHRFLRDHPGAHIAYTSDLVPSDVSGRDDLAHRVDIGYGAPGGNDYAFYGVVGHFSGRMIASGDFERGEEQRTVTLVDESFQLGLTEREAEASKLVPTTVYDAHMELVITGQGRYTFELVRDNKTTLAHYTGNALNDETTFTRDLGSLDPSGYTIKADALGQVGFSVRVDGVVVI